MIQIVDTATKGLPSPRLLSKFRMWVNNNWVENCEERQRYDEPRLDRSEYWHRFKWWIKREYQLQKKIEKEKHEKRSRFY
jgi:hypothetical protein